MISIVVPCYNCARTIGETIRSIKNQTCKMFQVVLVNDGSLDATADICSAWEQEDKRVKVIHQKNKGLMAAWKQGVLEADGEYIVFSDSDDWIQEDLIEYLEKIIKEKNPDMISYGMMVDLEKGRSLRRDNAISEGFYVRKEIRERIWPVYFSAGSGESMALLSSRCNKAIKRKLLLSNMKYLNNDISIGEDDITSFATVMSADSIYVIKNYFPYHYCRREDSMLGNYNVEMVKKFINVKRELFHIGKIYEYPYLEQIEENFLENILIVIKKTIADMNYDYNEILNYLNEMVNISEVNEILEKSKSMQGIGVIGRIFSRLLENRNFFLCIVVVKIASKFRKWFWRKKCRVIQ